MGKKILVMFLSITLFAFFYVFLGTAEVFAEEQIVQTCIQYNPAECTYTDWEDLGCVSADKMRQIRYKITGCDECDEPLERDVDAAVCACELIKQDASCIDDQHSEVTYTFYNDSLYYVNEYCPDDYAIVEDDPACSSDYVCGEWQNGSCAGDAVREQTRVCTNQYQNTKTETQTVNDASCGCVYSEWLPAECTADGTKKEVRTQGTQFGYCTLLEREISDATCACQYTEWQQTTCVSEGKMIQIRSKITDYTFCIAPLQQEIDSQECACQKNDTPGNCSKGGYRAHDYSWNFEFCGTNYSDEQPDSACVCQLVETGRQCSGDKTADVTYGYNHSYCGSGYTETKEDLSCCSQYACSEWQNMGCMSDNTMGQSRTCTDQYNNSYSDGRQFEDASCACVKAEQSRTCNGDGTADVSYAWNHAFCGAGYNTTENDASCACGYSDWTDTACSCDGSMKQTRTQTTSFNYCTALEQETPNTDCSCQYSQWQDAECTGDNLRKQMRTRLRDFDYCIAALVQEISDTTCAPGGGGGVCGNTVIETGEVCDGGTQTCTINGYTGTQSCQQTCSGWNVCQTTEFCGDAIINGNEECEGGSNCTPTCTLKEEGGGGGNQGQATSTEEIVVIHWGRPSDWAPGYGPGAKQVAGAATQMSLEELEEMIEELTYQIDKLKKLIKPGLVLAGPAQGSATSTEEFQPGEPLQQPAEQQVGEEQQETGQEVTGTETEIEQGDLKGEQPTINFKEVGEKEKKGLWQSFVDFLRNLLSF